MRLRHIEVFHAVYSNGSISAAARMLNVSQPAVSKVLRHAEQQLGFTLFDRSKGKLIPTNEGITLFTEVSRVYLQIGSLRRIARNIKSNRSGQIRIAAITGLAFDVLPRAIAKYQRDLPNVAFEVQTQHYRKLEPSLFEMENDIGLAFQPPSHQGLGAYDLGNAEFACVYKKGVFPGEPKRIKIAQIKGMEVIAMNGRGPLGSLLMDKMQNREIILHPRLVADTCFMATKFVKHIGGVTIVDEFTAKAQIDEDLAYAKFDPPMKFSVKALYLESRPLSSLCEDFLDGFKEEFKAITKF